MRCRKQAMFLSSRKATGSCLPASAQQRELEAERAQWGEWTMVCVSALDFTLCQSQTHLCGSCIRSRKILLLETCSFCSELRTGHPNLLRLFGTQDSGTTLPRRLLSSVKDDTSNMYSTMGRDILSLFQPLIPLVCCLKRKWRKKIEVLLITPKVM